MKSCLSLNNHSIKVLFPGRSWEWWLEGNFGLVLEGWPSKIEVSWVLGIYICVYIYVYVNEYIYIIYIYIQSIYIYIYGQCFGEHQWGPTKKVGILLNGLEKIVPTSTSNCFEPLEKIFQSHLPALSKGCQMVHSLDFNWHPFEGAGFQKSHHLQQGFSYLY